MIKRSIAVLAWASLATTVPLAAEAGQQQEDEFGGRVVDMRSTSTDSGFQLCVSIRNRGDRSAFITAGIETQILFSFSPNLPIHPSGASVHQSTMFGPPSWEDRSYILLARNSSIEHCIDYEWEIIPDLDQERMYDVQAYFSSWLDRGDRLSPYVILMTAQTDAIEPPLYRDEEIRSNICRVYWQERRVEC